MPHSGKIKSYDDAAGTGTITPEKGGDALSFKKTDLQQQGQTPKVDQHYHYETSEVDGGHKRAVNLQPGDGDTLEDRARNQPG